MPKRLLVTGGTGFVGGALVAALLRDGCDVLSLTRADDSNRTRQGFENDHGSEYFQIDHYEPIWATMQRFRPDAVVHLAAETQVDHADAGRCVRTNILGTLAMLQASHAYWRDLDEAARASFRYLHTSSGEVFGDTMDHAPADPTSCYRPRSPYAAAKAGADHLAQAWWHSYGLPVQAVIFANIFGPGQRADKLIPASITRALDGRALTVYDDGSGERDWLYIDDAIAALRRVLDNGRPGESFLVSGRDRRRNLDVVQCICALLDNARPRADGLPHASAIAFVPDRRSQGRGRRLSSAKLESELGWRAEWAFDDGLKATVQSHLDDSCCPNASQKAACS